MATTDCKARLREIQKLIERLNAPRSATVVFGDSSIGKTTLLKEVKRQLDAKPIFLAGFHEANTADPDPLMRALRDMLKSLDKTVVPQARVVFAQARASEPSLKKAADTLISILESTEESLHLPRLARVFKNLQNSFELMSPNFVQAPAAEEFANAVRLLRRALPSTRLVLIIDNVSAPFDSLSDSSRGASLDTIRSALEKELKDIKNVHFIFSWKVSTNTSGQLNTFRSVIKKFNGKDSDLHLGRIEDQQALSSWIAEEFPWFAKIPRSEQQQVVKLTEGLPAVVSAWRQQNILHYDPKRLREIADDAVSGEYQELLDALSDPSECPNEERRLVYGFSLTRHPMDAVALADMLETSPSACYNVLEKWEQRHLFRRIDDKSGGDNISFDFEHETKRSVVRRKLAHRFADGGSGLRAKIYGFFLSHCSLGTSRHPYAPYYIDDALELKTDGAGNAEPDASALKTMLRLCAEDGRGAIGQSAKEPPKDWPLNARAIFFAILFYKSDLKMSDLLDAAADSLGQGLNSPRLPGACLSLATTLSFLMHKMVPTEGESAPPNANSRLYPFIRRLLEWQERLEVAAPGESQVGMQRAITIANAAITFSLYGRPDLVAAQLNESRRLLESNQQPVFADYLAAALASSANLYAKLGDFANLQARLDELRSLYSRFHDSTPIAESFAAAIVKALGVFYTRNEPIQLDQLLKDVLDIGSEQTIASRPTFLGLLAEAVRVAIPYRRYETADTLVSRLRRYAEANQEALDGAEQVAVAVYYLLANDQRHRKIADAEAFVQELGALAERFPKSKVLEETLARGMAACMLAYGSQGKPERGDAIVDELRSVYASHRSDPAAAVSFAEALSNAIYIHSAPRSADKVSSFLDELRAIGPTKRDEPTIWLGEGLARAIAAHDEPAQQRRVRSLLAELKKLRRAHPALIHPDTVMRGLANAALYCERIRDRNTLEAYLKELRSSYKANAGELAAELLAFGMARAVGFYAAKGMVRKMEAALSELRKFASRFPTEDVKTCLAEGLASAAFGYYHQFDAVRGVGALKEVRTLRAAFGNSQRMAECLGVALSNCTAIHQRLGKPISAFVAEVRRLHEQFPESAYLQDELADCLANEALSHSEAPQSENLKAAMRELAGMVGKGGDEGPVKRLLSVLDYAKKAYVKRRQNTRFRRMCATLNDVLGLTPALETPEVRKFLNGQLQAA